MTAAKTLLRRARRAKIDINSRLTRHPTIDEAPPIDELPETRLIRSDSPPEIIGLAQERAMGRLGYVVDPETGMYPPGKHPLQRFVDKLGEIIAEYETPECTRVFPQDHEPPETAGQRLGITHVSSRRDQ
jgi:hypothetical protein